MSKDWDAVAAAINTRMEERDMTQVELSKRSRVSVATLRQIQQAVPKRRSPRTLSDISEALGFEPGYLERLADGEASLGSQPDRLSALEARVAKLEERLAGVETRHA